MSREDWFALLLCIPFLVLFTWTMLYWFNLA